MRALLVARKSLLELLRETQLLLLVLMLPLAFLGILAFAYNTPLLVTHPILLMGSDPQVDPLADELESQRYADGRPVFRVSTMTDRMVAEAALRAHEATALVVVSEEGSAVTFLGDAVYPRFYRASIILENVLSDSADRAAGRPQVIRVEAQPIGEAGLLTEFDIYAPGMMIFAMLLIIPQTAMLVAREIRWKTLRRLRLTPLRAWDLLGGISISQMTFAVLQVLIIFFSALALGFHNRGSLWLAILVGLVVCFSAVGLGLIVACFVENDSQAINVGSAVTMVQVFLSGSFYQLPPMTAFTLAGHQIDVFDIFPATHGFSALQQVLSYGASFEQISFRLVMAVVLSGIYFAIGVIIFQRLQLGKSSQ
jgi:ABC-2 type transport system permease protein